MRRLLACLLPLSIACATVPPPDPTPLIPLSRRFEDKPLPPDPSTEPLDQGIPKGDWVESIETGATATKPGECMSEEHAWRAARYQIRYKELRIEYGAARETFAVQREEYESVYAQDQKKLLEEKPNWLDRNALVIGMTGGIIVGVLVTLGVIYGVQKVEKVNP